MHIHCADFWVGLNTKGVKGLTIVDLRTVKNKDEAVLAIEEKMHGKNSSRLTTGNFDALEDVMTDWFVDNWGHEKHIYILGGGNLVNLDVELALNLVTIIEAAYLAAIYSVSQTPDIVDNDVPVHKEINHTHISLILN